MGNIVQAYMSVSLIVRILIGMVIGGVLGLAVPAATGVAVLGNLFVAALKAIAPLLVFILVLSALANAKLGGGPRFKTVVTLYLCSTMLAAMVAVAGSFIFPMTMSLNIAGATSTPPNGITEVLTHIANNMVANPVKAIADGNYVGILFWAVVLGLCLKQFAQPATLKTVDDFAHMVSSAVRFVIELAPLGILGLMYSSIAESGLAIFTDYGKLVLLLVGCMLLVALVLNPLLVALTLRRNPYPLVFRCLHESGITAFFTRSSAANIPVNMNLCKKLELDVNFYAVSIPLGATMNMSGAAVTISVMTMAVAHTLGMAVDLPTAFILCVLSAIGACGASGVAGGSLLLIPMACSLFGIGNDIAMQAVAVGFIIGVVQDSVETAVNSSSDALFTITAEMHEREKKQG